MSVYNKLMKAGQCEEEGSIGQEGYLFSLLARALPTNVYPDN